LNKSPETRSRLPWFGTNADKREAAISLIGSLFITVVYIQVAQAFDTPTTKLEFFSLIFSFMCVWLSRTENIFSMHSGIISTITMGIFLLRIEVVAQGWLQFVYYVPVQLYGWYMWCRGGENRTELQVSRLNIKNWVATTLFCCGLWALTMLVFSQIYENPQYLLWDASIVAASIVAQTLMTFKKVESWIFWSLPVNTSAIVLYLRTDVPAFSFLYAVFLLNAVWGWQQWKKSESSTQ
jgi:nicotinamide mononucleotide transporter